MYNSLNQQQREEFEKILRALGESLDISETQYNALVKSYEAVGTFLQNDTELSVYDPLVTPQGSLRLGTIIAPINEDDDIDVDLVFRLKGKNPTWTAKTLKDKVGARLRNSPRYQDMLDDEGRRCWTLLYRQDSANLKERYHMDILPSVASRDYDEQMRSVLTMPFDIINLDRLSIRITDKEREGYSTLTNIFDWLKSNPDGYALWFANKCREKAPTRQLITEDIIPIGKYNPNKTPLQRIVQILKRHRDVLFGHNKQKPISIIITTLAAQAYKGESNILEGLFNVVAHMKDFIKTDNEGNSIVANPLNPLENYAEKWKEDPIRKKNFFKWLEAIQNDLNTIISCKGPSIWRSMDRPFGHLIVESANKRYTDSIKAGFKSGEKKIASSGVLGTMGHSLNAGNTFYGKE